MAGKLFVSFKTSDTPRVRPACEALRKRGFTVFWSNDIPAGSPNYQTIIKRELLDADAVVVVWTNESVHSGPVVQECAQAERLNKLFQILLDDIEPIDLPMEVKYKAQKTMLHGWTGDTGHIEWVKLVAAIKKRLGRRETSSTRSEAAGSSTADADSSAARAQALRDEFERKRKSTRAAFEGAGTGVPLLHGAVRVIVGSGADDREQWIVPGSGKTNWFKDVEGGPEMVILPAGHFKMGSPSSEPKRGASEGPLHDVHIAAPFAVGRFAVTFEQWDIAFSEGGCRNHRPSDEKWGRGSRPVINVSWDDAKAYVAWLSTKSGKSYRLLSEAEWEYAARANTQSPYWWGSSISREQANYNGRYVYAGGGTKGNISEATEPVERFAPNSWGLYQVHGNVWEWCEDVWHKDYAGAHSDGSPWSYGGIPGKRVIRGGSYCQNPWWARAACRFGEPHNKREHNMSFRVARDLE